jgi:CheY-like chemotaxis protein
VTDREQLEQVILKLVTNARDAMPQGGRVRIATTRGIVHEATAYQHNARPGIYVQLSIADTGVGIDPDTQAHLFEPFFQRTGLRGGSGLGLAKVYGIIRQSGGFIELLSEPGTGSSFTISLPRCETFPPAQMVGRSTEPLRGHKTILVVEDDEDVRLVVSDMLRAQGYRVSEACDGVEALQVLQDSPDPVHMVLTDVMMPRMTGPELVKRLESLSMPVKVLYMSGYTDEILEPAAGQRLGFIQKPFTSTVLLQKVCETFAVSEPN